MLDYLDIKNLKYPTCQKDGFHEDEPVNMICLEQNCLKEKNYLLCTQCFDNSHKTHQIRPLKFILALLMKQNSQNGYENLEQYVEDSLNQETIAQFLEQQKQSTLEKYQEIINGLLEKSTKIEQMYIQYFNNLGNYIQNHFHKEKNINSLLKEVVEKSFEIESLQKNMDLVIERQESLLQQEINRLKIQEKKNENEENITAQHQTLTQYLENDMEKDKFVLTNQKLIEKMEKGFTPMTLKLSTFDTDINKICQSQIDSVQNLLKESQKFMDKLLNGDQMLQFIFVKNSNAQSQAVIETEPGIAFEANPLSQNEQTIVSNISFNSGVHGYTMQINKFSTTCFIIGVYEEHEANENKATNGSHPWSCLFNACKGKIKVIGQYQNFSQTIKNGDLIKVQMDYDNNEYTVKDEHGKCEYIMQQNQYNFAGKNIKFFISFYSANCNVSMKIIDTY